MLSEEAWKEIKEDIRREDNRDKEQRKKERKAPYALLNSAKCIGRILMMDGVGGSFLGV